MKNIYVTGEEGGKTMAETEIPVVGREGMSTKEMKEIAGRVAEIFCLASLPCLYCGKLREFAFGSPEANGIFNVFCPGGDCEDRYAAGI